MRESTRRKRNQTVRALLRKLDAHRLGEAAHAQRVAVYAVAIGQRMGLEGDALFTLKEAALLHDLGKLRIDPRILSKKTLAPGDLELLQSHPVLFTGVPKPKSLAPCATMVRHHHERWDGGGYPDGLRGENIPIGARILAIAEAFDALANGVGWRKPLEEAEALEVIKRAAGSHFDPVVVKAFFAVQPLIQPVDQGG